jgi:hypothetical protein
MKLHQPIVFQGNLNKNRYFEGWYFKQVSFNRENVISFIPGVALTKTDKHAFIQVIDGITRKTWNIKYPLSDFDFSKNEFKVRIGNSEFSEKGIALNIDAEDLKVNGNINFSDLVKFPSTWFSPGIMGWYSFVPFMECKHGIGSVLHGLQGSITVNNSSIDFTGGSGYIEKDWGTSFPESWIWLHCNTFRQPNVSFTFSVAKIPWLGNFFIGHICFLYCNGKFYLFATYNNSKIRKLTFKEREINIEISNRTHLLKVKAVQNMSGELKAPVTGEMNRIIKESIDSTIEIELWDTKNQLVFSDKGTHAGLEIIEKILSYF